MMKSSCAIFLLFVCCFNAAAQRKGFYIGFNGGFGGASLLHQNLSENIPGGTSKLSGYAQGQPLDAGYMFTDNIGVFGGIGLGIAGWKVNDKSGSLDLYSKNAKEISGSQSYVTVPLYVRLVTGRNNNRPAFYVNAGLSTSFITNGEVNDLDTSFSGKDQFAKVSFAPFTNFGIYIPCGDRRKGIITVGPEFSYTLNNIFNNDKNGHLLTYGLHFGFNVFLGQFNVNHQSKITNLK